MRRSDHALQRKRDPTLPSEVRRPGVLATSARDGRRDTSAGGGTLRTVLEAAGARNLADLAAKPTREVIAALDQLPLPASEALLGALVLNAVDKLRDATERLDTSMGRLLALTRALVVLAALTLGAAIVTLIATT